MDSNLWFESGCNYQQGVTLYASLKGHRPNLLRLFLKKQSVANAEKLKYELGKYRENPAAKITTPAILKGPSKSTRVPSSETPKIATKTAVSKSFYSLNQLHIDLHPLAQKQRSNFQEAISKHLQLTRLAPEEEDAALVLCIDIEELFDAIENAQRVLDHYVKHKVVLHIDARNFKQMTAPQLLRSRNNKSTSVSKYKKKVAVLQQQLKEITSKSERTKTKVALEKAEKNSFTTN